MKDSIGRHETKIDLAGEELPAMIEYEVDGPGPEGILISSVLLRRCVKERGDLSFDERGAAYKVTSPEFISTEIFPFLNGQQLKLLAEDISADLEGQNWNETMNEPNYINYDYPPNYAGVSA